MKTANFNQTPTGRANIIVFPGSLAARGRLARISTGDGANAVTEMATQSHKLHVCRIPENIRELFHATREILSRRTYVRTLSAIRQVEFSRRVRRAARSNPLDSCLVPTLS